MRDRVDGVIRDYCCKARRSWPAREDSSTRELASPIGLLTCAQQWIALLVSISKINPFLDDGCPRAQRAIGCPRAQRARACCQEPAGSRAVRRLCINQILAARPTAESWGPSTPSTRHLLDGVAVPVPHSVLVEKGLRAPNLRTGPNERSVRTRRNAIFPPSSARASASLRRRASAS